MGELTVAELNARARCSGPRFELAVAAVQWDVDPWPYEKWADTVEGLLCEAIKNIGHKRHNFQRLGEDTLTAALLLYLEGTALTADSEVVNGNCDISITFQGFKWLGEAKLANDMSWMWKGYNQLTTRYGTGQVGETRGGLLVYDYESFDRKFMQQWEAALREQEPETQFAEFGGIANSFRSRKQARATGSLLDTVHMHCSLFFEPEDANAKLSEAAKRAAAEVRKA